MAGQPRPVPAYERQVRRHVEAEPPALEEPQERRGLTCQQGWQARADLQKMSLMDVLIAVGGVTEFAAGNRASVIRIVDGKQQKFNVRLDDLIKDGDISANMPMRPGDVLVIPETWF